MVREVYVYGRQIGNDRRAVADQEINSASERRWRRLGTAWQDPSRYPQTKAIVFSYATSPPTVYFHLALGDSVSFGSPRLSRPFGIVRKRLRVFYETNFGGYGRIEMTNSLRTAARSTRELCTEKSSVCALDRRLRVAAFGERYGRR